MSEPKKMAPGPEELGAERDVVAARAIGELAVDLRRIIEATRVRVAQTVNSELVMLNWQIGNFGRFHFALGKPNCEWTHTRQLQAPPSTAVAIFSSAVLSSTKRI